MSCTYNLDARPHQDLQRALGQGRTPSPLEPFPADVGFDVLFDIMELHDIVWLEKSRDIMLSCTCLAYLTFQAMRMPYCGILFRRIKTTSSLSSLTTPSICGAIRTRELKRCSRSRRISIARAISASTSPTAAISGAFRVVPTRSAPTTRGDTSMTKARSSPMPANATTKPLRRRQARSFLIRPLDRDGMPMRAEISSAAVRSSWQLENGNSIGQTWGSLVMRRRMTIKGATVGTTGEIYGAASRSPRLGSARCGGGEDFHDGSF